MAERVPTGPEGLPLVGTNLDYAEDPLRFMERAASHGDAVRIEALTQEMVLLTDPAGIKHVLSDEAANYRKPDFGGDGLGRLLGDGLLTSDGDFWREMRTTIQPAFFQERLAEYGDRMVTESERVADAWSDGEVIDLREEMAHLTLRIVVGTLLGADSAGMERAVADALQDVGEMFRPDNVEAFLPDALPTPRKRRYGEGVDRLERVLRDLIRQRRADEAYGDDVLGLLLAAKEREDSPVTDEQVRDELMTMLLAGHDTTALTLTYTWYLLSTDERVRERFHEEIDAIDGRPGVADAAGMSYTGQILNESMRLYPPVYTMFREATGPDTVAGYRIDAGDLLMCPQWVLHRDERFWDDPETFRPERWDDTDHPDFAYFPFGGGPRTCIGNRFAVLEAKLILATLGRRYRLDPVSEGTPPLLPVITLQPAEVVQTRVSARA